MKTLTIDQLELQGVLQLERGELLKPDLTVFDRAPVLRPSDVAHYRIPERLSNEYDEPLSVPYPTAIIGQIAVCLHYSPGSSCLISEPLDGSVPTKGVVLCSMSGNNLVDSQFLKTWFLSGALVSELQRFQIGTAMKTVKMSDFRQVRVPIPDIEIQRSIYKAVEDARESESLVSELARETNRLLRLQNDLFIANITELQTLRKNER